MKAELLNALGTEIDFCTAGVPRVMRIMQESEVGDSIRSAVTLLNGIVGSRDCAAYSCT